MQNAIRIKKLIFSSGKKMKLYEELEQIRNRLILVITCSILLDILLFSFPFIIEIIEGIDVGLALTKALVYTVLNLTFMIFTLIVKSKKKAFFLFIISIVILLKSILFFCLERIIKLTNEKISLASDITFHACSLLIKAGLVFAYYKLYHLSKTIELRSSEGGFSNTKLDSTGTNSIDEILIDRNIKDVYSNSNQIYIVLNDDESFNTGGLNTPKELN